MSLRLQPVQVATGSTDRDRQLMFDEGFLVAVLACLSDEHQDEAGKWFLKTGFGRVNIAIPPMFVDLDEAKGWIDRRLIVVEPDLRT